METRELTQILAARYWRDDDARQVLSAWCESGLSAAEFGRRHGVRPSRLLRWSKLLPASRQRALPLSFVELALGRNSACGVALELVVAGVTVRVPPGFDRLHLADVIRAVRGLAC